MIRNFSALLILLILLPPALQAQYGRIGMLEYTLGARVGVGSGISFQYFPSDDNSFEVIASARSNSLSATGLYVYHIPTPAPGLKWFLGGGAHATALSVGTERDDINSEFIGHVFVPGVDAVVGFEYFFRSAPMMISFDYKPEYNFGIVKAIDRNIAAFTVRYRF